MINGVLGKNVIFLLRSIDTNWVWIELFEIWSTAYIQYILGDYHSYTVEIITRLQNKLRDIKRETVC